MHSYKSLFALATVGLFGGLSSAFAADMNSYDDCVVVPAVQWNSAQKFTSIGLIANNVGTISWAFFDVNGMRRANSSIQVNIPGPLGFSWNTTAPGASTLQNVLGYILFCMDDNRDGQILNEANGLTASAFFIDLGNKDVSMIPTIGLDEMFLANNLPTQWATDPVTNFSGGAAGTNNPPDSVTVRYLVDFKPPTASDNQFESKIYLYTSADPGRNQTAAVVNGPGDRRNVTFQTNQRLTEINPENFTTVPAGQSLAAFGDATLAWTVPNTLAQVYVFSFIDAKVFGAVQTILGDVFP